MKKRFVLLAVLAAWLPLVAAAQQVPPDPAQGAPEIAGPMSQQERNQMRGFMEQMRTLRQQYRSQMLAALTPEHRQLLATIAGQLATSPNPDPKAAAKQLDDALTSSEKQGILKAEQSYRTQTKALHDKMLAQMQARRPQVRQPDPGMLLLAPEGGLMHQTMVFGFGEGPPR
jgi:hypothetical protein